MTPSPIDPILRLEQAAKDLAFTYEHERNQTFLCDSMTHRLAYQTAAHPRTIIALCAVARAAHGLSFGTDWNHGTQAGHHRQQLLDALKALAALESTP